MSSSILYEYDYESQAAKRRIDALKSRQTELIEAFIAKYGCQPGDAVLISEPQPDGSFRSWIEKKQPPISAEQKAFERNELGIVDRKGEPVFSGVMQYFPRALRAVSRVSKAGNDKHNPGQPLHWAHDKSCDQPDAAARHMLTPYDTDPDTGEMHLAHAAWRVLAWLEMTLWMHENGGDCPPNFQKIGIAMADQSK